MSRNTIQVAADLGRPVKWQDADGGWHTGQTVKDATGYTACTPTDHGPSSPRLLLVRESCNGNLVWVHEQALETWASRNEWER